MKKIAIKFKSFQEAEKWEINQQIQMAPEQRQKIAKKLRDKFFGTKNLDIRQFHDT